MTERAKILLVEDDLICVALLTQYLESKNYEIISARNGLQAIALVSEVRPDLILSDVIMPKMNGLDFLRHVRQSPDTHCIPFIFLTARSLASDRVEGLKEGANAYIIKPFNLGELLAQVESLLKVSYSMRETAFRQSGALMQASTHVKLTNAELSISKLVAQGLTNTEIAKQLVISRRTVEGHISRMLRKTQLSNRTELSRWILENRFA
jgi:DNA-binding NarL/FixJ family response regulator